LELEHGTTTAEVTHIVTVGGGNNGDPGTGPLAFTFSPSAPAVGQQVTFTASGATGGGSYKWKFPGDLRKFGPIVTFTFAAAGSYEVELELEHGTTTAQVTHIVTVGGGNNGGGQNVTSIDFSWSPQAAKAGQAVSFIAALDR
jgi:hypothetical protein